MAIDVTLPDPPTPAVLVDGARKITIPWVLWIAELLAQLRAAMAALSGIDDTLAAGVPARILTVEAFVGNSARRGGWFIVDGVFEAEQIGSPVIVQVLPARVDEAQGVLTCARAEVLDTRRLRVDWSSSGPLAGDVRVLLVIGGQ